MAGLLSASGFGRLHSELKIEDVRKSHYPHQVSRLTGLFVFDEIESVAHTWTERGWGGHFSTKNLTDVGVASNRTSRVDANWISKMMDCDCKLVAGSEEMIHNYWAGEACPGQPPIWERIVEGWMTVWGTDLKKRALDEIGTYWPESLKLLEYSANAAQFRSPDGGIYPAATISDNKLHVEYYVRMIDAKDEDFFKRMEQFFIENPERRCHIPGALDMRTPDFTMYSAIHSMETIAANNLIVHQAPPAE